MKVIVTEFTSLDGVVQAPGGPEEDPDGGFRHGGWSMKFFDPQVMGPAINEVSERTDALLQGRRTWQVMAGAWPQRAGDPFADWMNSVQKYVVSDSLSAADLTWTPTTLSAGATWSGRCPLFVTGRAAISASWAARPWSAPFSPPTWWTSSF